MALTADELAKAFEAKGFGTQAAVEALLDGAAKPLHRAALDDAIKALQERQRQAHDDFSRQIQELQAEQAAL
jgi:hypothetical protein